MTRKSNDQMNCFNDDFYGDGQCFESPALVDYSISIPQMTKGDCSTTCQVLSTKFYGVENGDKCYCGNVPVSSESGTCDLACEGDQTELDCGGADSTLVSTVKDSGSCFSNLEVLYERYVSSNLDHTSCLSLCRMKGLTFFGLQGNRCFCGNYLRNSQPGTCDTACEGDLTEICGGENAVLVLPVEESPVQSFSVLCGPCDAAKDAQKAACIFSKTSGVCKAAHKACDVACIFCVGCPEP